MEDPHPTNQHLQLQEIVRVGHEKFPARQEVYWENKDTLKKAVQDELATRFGFTIAENGNSFLCGRGMNPKHSTPAYKKMKLADAVEHSIEGGKKTRNVNSIRCGCTFRIQYTKASAKIPLAPPEAVRITNASFLHTHGCQPSVAQVQVMRKRNGHFTVQVSKQKMWDIIQLLNAGHVPSRLLRYMLQQVLPQSVVFDSQLLTNFRLKAKRLGPTCAMESIDTSPAALELSNSNFTDSDDTPFLDLATKHAREILQEALSSDENKWKVQVYMEKLASKDVGFSYSIARAADGSPTGVVWMTPAMRAAFEAYGECLFLDAMKRQQNSLHWPYIAIVVLDGDKKIFVACESISCAERIETYAWICNFVFTHAPRRPRKDVLMIFSDCFVTSALLQSLGIEDTCNLGWDAYHLFREDWPSYFGNALWPVVKDSMSKMLFGETEVQYHDGFNSAIALMRNQDCKYNEYLQRWHRNRDKFAKHIVSHQAGSLRRHGSSHAEQNHSSFVQRIGPVCLDDPATAISTILRRHADISSERNHSISKYHLSVASIVQQSKMDAHDINAINFLSSWGFELWQEMRSEAHNYQVEHISDDVIHVCRIEVCNPKPRIFSTSNGTRCDCRHRVALRIQCPHETALANGEFLPHLWNELRWQQRPKLMLSNDSQLCRTEGDDIEVQEYASNQETHQDDVSLDSDCNSIDTPLPQTFPDDSIPTTQQDAFTLMEGTTQDDDSSGVGARDESIVCQSQLHVTNDVVVLAAQSSSTITYAMLKRVACELVEVAMKQNDASKKVSVCGMILRVTNLLKGNDSLGTATFNEAIEQYLHSFSAGTPNLFPGRNVPDHHRTQAPASVPCNGRPTTNRLRSRTETFRLPKTGASKRRSCGFCLEDGHTVNQCTLMAHRGKLVPHCDKDQFCYGILETFAVKQLNHRLHPSPSIFSHLVGAAHISITDLYAMSRGANAVVVNKKKNREIGIKQVIAKVTLWEGGNPLDIDSQLSANDFYALTSVMSWIAKSPSKKRVFHNLTNLSEVDDFEY
ncbi:hypothetical protein MHU86_18567 [Fragilaria crotonensis]|nr:hypothetical protein MHU86_18567 [Fragilaria crotonensis]